MTSPQEIHLRSDALEVTLLPELGARLHRLRAFGHDVLRTPDDPSEHRRDPFFWGAYVMAPWCNRASAGKARVAGRVVALQPNFPDGSAIHGLVGAQPWEPAEGGALGIGWRAGAGGWPWAFHLRLDAEVRGPMLRLAYLLVNRSDAAMPAGIGLHPWLTRPVELRVPAASAYASNAGSAAEPSPVDGPLDLRRSAAPAVGLDGTWVALAEPVVDLAWPDLDMRARIEVTSLVGTLVAVANPEGIPAVAVEPQTHGPDPFRRLAGAEPDAPVLLAPGGELRFALDWHFTLARNVLASGRYG